MTMQPTNQSGLPIAVVGLFGGRPVGADAETAVREATLVAGSADQLAATADLRRTDAVTALVEGGLGALDEVVAHRGPACILASGDPGFFGIARALRVRLDAAQIDSSTSKVRPIVVHPAPSSVALAFARAGVSWDGAVVRSCHGGLRADAIAEVAEASVAAVLCGPDAPPEVVAAALLAQGASHRMAVVAAHLAEAGETVTVGDIGLIAAGTFPHRSVLVVADPLRPGPASVRPGGRAVAEFAHRAGMITKPEVRSVVLGKLDLPANGVFWDLGAGSGSVAIEAALAAPHVRVIAVERNRVDADRAIGNAAAFGAPVEIVCGGAPEALVGLPDPDRVFVGGGGLDVLDAAWARLRPGGRLVATFAAIDRAAEAHRRLGSLVQVSVDRADTLPDGGVRFAAENPVFVAWGDKPAVQSERSLNEVAPVVAIGVGCSSQATADEVAAVVAEVVAASPAGTGPASLVATVDLRRDHPAITGLVDRAERSGATSDPAQRLIVFPAGLLAEVEVPTPSALVADAIGTASVAEAAALLAAGPGARLVVTKHKGPTATAAVAVGARPVRVGRVTVVGLGPGAAVHRTPAAVIAVRAAEVIVGYGPYVDAVTDLIRPEQWVVRSIMGAESDRAAAAVSLASAGWQVVVVSSGDAGVFAMASTVLEAAIGLVGLDGEPLAVDVVPGVTAAHAGAAAAGAPLAAAHAVITLSDILTPWARIEAQLRAAAESGLALALYNPRSKGRPDHLARALAVLADVLADETVVVVVTAAGDESQRVDTATLGTIDPAVAGMRSVVLVGTADTTVDPAGHVVTSRHHPPSVANNHGARP